MNPIEIEHLSLSYGRLEAVHDLSLSLPTGSLCAMVGPNGAGKTTTLRALAGLLRPRRGSVRVLGTDAFELGVGERARIGFLDERQQQPEWMTVARLLDYCRPFYPSWDRALEADLLRRFELPLDRPLSKLSRGMRMKALLISVTAFRPAVLLLDEPFSGFDPVVRDDVSRGLIEVAQAGECTILLSSHDIEEVERVADRLVMLDKGRKLLDEETGSLVGRHRRIDVDLGAPADLRSAQGAGGQPWPAHWSAPQVSGNRIQFTDTAYAHDGCEAACRARWPEAAVRAVPMGLREIYLHVARGAAAGSDGNRASLGASKEVA